MKKCSYCGAEYPDDALRCATDGEPLPGGPQEMPPISEAIAIPALPVSAEPASDDKETGTQQQWTDRQIRIFEVVLMCAVAFSASIWQSLYLFANNTIRRSAGGASEMGLIANSLDQTASLALLWYVLRRRSKTFSDLGFKCTLKDIGWSIPLFIGTMLLRHGLYLGFHAIANSAGYSPTLLTRAGPPAPLLLLVGFSVLDPFFEELIVRAYLMTEVRQITAVS